MLSSKKQPAKGMRGRATVSSRTSSRPAKVSRVNAKQTLLSKLIPATKKAQFLVFILVFAALGGGYYAYRSFANTATTPVMSTPGIFRPKTGEWFLRNELSGGNPHYGVFKFGTQEGDRPVVGDWNGDKKDTIGVYRNKTGEWFLRNELSGGNPDAVFVLGSTPGDIPVTGDWDGDGKTGVGIYRPSTGTWYLRNKLATGTTFDAVFVLGTTPGDVPVVGDWDGDGKDGVGIYRAATGEWFLRNELAAGTSFTAVFKFGTTLGDKPVVGDWNGDGKDTPGIYRPSTGEWFLRNSLAGGNPDYAVFKFGTTPGDVPLVGDWDGVLQVNTEEPPDVNNNQVVITATAACATPRPTVRQGDKNECVKRVQQILNQLDKAGLVEDGNFGSATKTAVVNYQKAKGLRDDGIVGNQTWASLESGGQDNATPVGVTGGGSGGGSGGSGKKGVTGGYGDKVICENTIQKQSSSANIAECVKIIQRKVGAVDDGSFGGDTAKKVIEFKKKYGLQHCTIAEVGRITWPYILGKTTDKRNDCNTGNADPKPKPCNTNVVSSCTPLTFAKPSSSHKTNEDSRKITLPRSKSGQTVHTTICVSLTAINTGSGGGARKIEDLPPTQDVIIDSSGTGNDTRVTIPMTPTFINPNKTPGVAGCTNAGLKHTGEGGTGNHGIYTFKATRTGYWINVYAPGY